MRIDQPFTNEPATVKDHGFALSSEKKTPYIWIEFVFDNLTGEHNEEVDVRAALYITEKTLPYTLEKLGNLGWAGKSLEELDTNGSAPVDLRGRKALLTGIMENYEGKMRPKVNFINDPSYIPDQPIDKKELQILSGKMAAKIAAYRSKNGVKAAKKPEPVAVPAAKTADDEIPF